MSSSKILERQVRMLQLAASGLGATEIVKQIVEEKLAGSESAAWETWRSREEWAPLLVRAPDDVKAIITPVLRDIEEARRLGFVLYHTTRSGPSKVGALGKVLDAAQLETQIRTNIGQLKKAADKIEVSQEVKHEFPEFTPEEISRYAPILFQVALEDDGAAKDRADAEKDSV